MALAVFCDSDPLGLVLHLESGSGGSVWVSPNICGLQISVVLLSILWNNGKNSGRVPTFDW